MANVTAKTSSNIFYKARCEAATHNEQLSSREGAADYMSIDRGRLYRIESAGNDAVDDWIAAVLRYEFVSSVQTVARRLFKTA